MLLLFSSAIDLLTVLDMRVPQCLEKIPIFGKILEAIQQKVYNYSELFLGSQIEAIKATKYSAKKRSGIFVYVEIFPRFVTRFETILKDSGVSKGKKGVLYLKLLLKERFLSFLLFSPLFSSSLLFSPLLFSK
jgi:hypothetical protein